VSCGESSTEAAGTLEAAAEADSTTEIDNTAGAEVVEDGEGTMTTEEEEEGEDSGEAAFDAPASNSGKV